VSRRRRRAPASCAAAGALVAAVAAIAGCASPPPVATGGVVAGHARFTVVTPECIRIEYQPEGRFVDAPSLFAAARGARHGESAGRPEGPSHSTTVDRSGRRLTIDTGRIRLTYEDDGAAPGAANLRAEIRGGAVPIVWTPGADDTGNLGGTLKALGGVRGPVDLGRGVLSRGGWSLVDDSRTPLYTADGWVEARPGGSGSDWYLFGYGQDYGAALRALAAVAGDVPMPRRYALGSWYSRYWPLAAADFERIVAEYREHQVPLDVLAIDTDWHGEGWTGWSWNRDLIPDPEGLIRRLHAAGIAVALNLHHAGGVAPNEDAYVPFMRALGLDPAARRVVPFDASDRRYLETLFATVVGPLETAGVDFFWIDWQQLPNTRLPGLSNLAWLNDRHYRRSESGGRRGQILSRWAGWGDQRNPMPFSGDADARWEVLRFEVPFTATAGNAGAFFWSHDIGGHRGPRDPEMFTRWVQFGALSPAVRLHSTRAADLDRRPWTYGSPWQEAMGEALRLRARLFPYIYSSVWRCHRDTLPLVRPLYLETPADARAYDNPQEYLLGDALLAAPIATEGAGAARLATQAVLFPAGRWRDWNTGEAFAGGDEAIVTAAIDEIPLYVREGVPIPMQAARDRMSADPPPEIVVRCWPGAPGRFTLYEDDGLSTAYLEGRRATTDLACARDGDRVAVTIAGAQGAFDGQPPNRAWVVEVAGVAPAGTATVDGAPAAVERDESLGIERVRVPARPVAQGVKVEITAAAIGDAALRTAAAERRARRALGAPADPFVQGAAYAARGLALCRKVEGPYMLGGADLLLVQDRAGLTSGPVVVTVEERAGARAREVLRQESARLTTLRLPLPAFPQYEDPPVGVPLVRAAGLAFTDHGRPMVVAKLLDRQESHLRRFRVAGAFPYRPGTPLASQAFGPEKSAAAPAASFDDGAGGRIAWRPASAGADGTVDLRAVWDADERLAYATAVLRSPRRQRVTFRVFSDDGVMIWLNGERIHVNDVTRALDIGPDVVTGTLVEGRNVLLLKIANVVHGWAFRVGIETEVAVEEEADKS
jgi:glycosyl hydrolase family 31/uncharacterized protein DUF5110